jgi:hypothetical protein
MINTHLQPHNLDFAVHCLGDSISVKPKCGAVVSEPFLPRPKPLPVWINKTVEKFKDENAPYDNIGIC